MSTQSDGQDEQPTAVEYQHAFERITRVRQIWAEQGTHAVQAWMCDFLLGVTFEPYSWTPASTALWRVYVATEHTPRMERTPRE